MSATPAKFEFERKLSEEQIIRPTGLLDPQIEIRPIKGQVEHLIGEVNRAIEKENGPGYYADKTTF